MSATVHRVPPITMTIGNSDYAVVPEKSRRCVSVYRVACFATGSVAAFHMSSDWVRAHAEEIADSVRNHIAGAVE